MLASRVDTFQCNPCNLVRRFLALNITPTHCEHLQAMGAGIVSVMTQLVVYCPKFRCHLD
jgi:hypothetical protein